MGGRRVLVDWIAEPPDTPSAFSFYSVVVLQVLAGLEAIGCQTTLTDLTRQGADRAADLAGADAVVFCSPVGDRVVRLVDGLARDACRVALFQELPGALTVNPDDELGGRLAAELFHRLGHRRVAMYGTPDQASQVARGAAFRRRLAQLDPDAHVEALHYRLQADGVTASLTEMQAPLAARLASTEPLPTAVFCAGGYATFALYRFLRTQGLSIPRTIGVVGYDSLPFYEAIDTPISHIGFDLSNVTREAVAATARLLDPATNAAREEPRTVPCALDDRGSLLPVSEMDHALAPSR
jgi:LacI family transcriptional regulator